MSTTAPPRGMKSDLWLSIALRAGVLFLFVWMVKGILVPIALGGLFALLLYPLHVWLARKLGRRSSWGPLILTIGSMVLVVGPMVLLGMKAVASVEGVVQGDWAGTAQRGQAFVSDKLDVVGRYLQLDRERIRSWTEAAIGQIGTSIGGFAGAMATGLPGMIVALFLFVVSLYYFLRDGRGLSRWLTKLLPFAEGDTEELFESIRTTVRGAILGEVVTALVQGTLTTIALFAFRIPAALAFGVAATLLALIPMIGTTPVTVGATIYLFAIGRPGAAVGMAAIAIGIGLSDNVIRPWVQTSSSRMHPLVVLLGIFGGLQIFGGAGIFLGPVIAAMGLWSIDTYAALQKKRAREAAPVAPE